jgi:bacterioferritin-associated ferredoxin
MIICQCYGKTDRDVKRAVREGARTSEDVARRCQAGQGCGGCCPEIEAAVARANVQARADDTRSR